MGTGRVKAAGVGGQTRRDDHLIKTNEGKDKDAWKIPNRPRHIAQARFMGIIVKMKLFFDFRIHLWDDPGTPEYVFQRGAGIAQSCRNKCGSGDQDQVPAGCVVLSIQKGVLKGDRGDESPHCFAQEPLRPITMDGGTGRLACRDSDL